MRAVCTALVLVATGCGVTGAPCGPSTAVVADVIDGDTVVLETGEHVRYLLVDAPEITQGKNDCYGTQARDFNRDRVLGKTVELRYEQECADKYQRLLAFVRVDGEEINSALVSEGLACVLAIPPDGMARETEFRDLASVARTERRGMWGACPKVKCGN